MKRILFALLFTLLISTSIAQAEPVLRIAVEDHYPPYSYKNEKGQMAGFNVDIANALAAKMHMKCEIISVAWDDILPRLKSNDFDAAVACMAIKPERRQYADFTDYYIQSKSGFIGRKGMSSDTSPAAMTGKILVSQAGTAQLAYLEKTYGKNSTVLGLKTMDAAFIAVADGNADLALGVLLAGFEFLNTPKGQECDIIGPALTEDQFDYSPGHIAVGKGNDELREKLNAALKKLRVDGTYAQIGRKYFPFSPY